MYGSVLWCMVCMMKYCGVGRCMIVSVFGVCWCNVLHCGACVCSVVYCVLFPGSAV